MLHSHTVHSEQSENAEVADAILQFSVPRFPLLDIGLGAVKLSLPGDIGHRVMEDGLALYLLTYPL